ncbi:MAG: winged helix-turn-helix domain-containing protein [Acidobacteria bacterium]|nr:winged helix-turn-helix domain-containing protein [Acidobacteriota bacterium]
MPAATASPRLIRFHDFELDVCTGHLRKRGVRIKLRDQAVEVLTILLQHPGELVTREAFRRHLWPDDVFVDFDNSLNTAVARLREVLGDSADHPRFIETISKRGYRFVADLPQPVPEPEPAPKPRLLVMPLLNLSGDPSQEYFSDAMAEEIITAVASLASDRLAVIARTTAMCYKGTSKDVTRIGQELAVDYLVEGSVRLAQDVITINLQLIQVRDQTHLWAEHYEAKAEDVFRIQREAALAIVNRIGIASGGNAEPTSNGQSPAPRKQTCDLVAYNYYLQGRANFNKWTPEGFRLAKQYLDQSIARDPNYAPAYDSLAELYWYIGFFGYAPPKDAFSTGIFAALRAVELDPTLGDTHALIGMYRKELDYNWQEVERQMKHALEISPASPVVRLRYALSGLCPHGLVAEAAAQIEMAVESDPLSLFVRWWLGGMRALARQYDQAFEQYRLILEIDPFFAFAHWGIGLLYHAQGRFDLALDALRKATECSGESPLMLGWLGLECACSGNTEEACAIRDRLEAIAAHAYVPPTGFAWIAFGLGDLDSAFAWLERAVDARDPFIIPIKTYAVLDPFRSDPRYRKVLARMNLEP